MVGMVKVRVAEVRPVDGGVRLPSRNFASRGLVSADYYAPVTSTRPVLIFSGEDDPVTPPTWGEHVKETLPNSRHVVVPGAGHITLMRGCVRDLVGAFLDRASVDGLDASCVRGLTRPPFFTSYTGPGPQK